MSNHLFSRTDRSLIAQWWWRIDRVTLLAVCGLLLLGILAVGSASPAIAEQLGIDSFYFVKRHAIYGCGAIMAMIVISMMPLVTVRRLMYVLFAGALLGCFVTYFWGSDIKGARRWISVMGISLQPSEFLKPAFVVVCAWLLAQGEGRDKKRSHRLIFCCWGVVALALVLQPDVGLLILITLSLLAQLFLSGLSLAIIGISGALGIASMIVAYYFIPHVRLRVDRFMAPASADKYSDRYQISQSLEAYQHGGYFGVGPGEGVVKKHLPDAHADFVFSVLSEEYGSILMVIILLLFAFVYIRPIVAQFRSKNYFVALVVSGLTSMLMMQTFINIASTLDLIPTKGMTLPFLSFGGSSLLSVGISFGIVLCALKKEVRGDINPGILVYK